jgi:molybdopterin-guanine dinucleotide biosynthesis protein A
MPITAADVSAFILVGGKSSRMGSDKAFVTLDGRTLLARALDLASSIAPNVYIVGDPAKFASFAPVVQDIFQNCGPLAGIHAALRASQNELNLILAVDVPFLSPTLLQYLITRARNANSAAVTAAHTAEGWQPLAAVYRRAFADQAENSLRHGHYKIDTLFTAPGTQAITEQELQTAGFSPRLFTNLNTKEDLSKAETSNKG